MGIAVKILRKKLVNSPMEQVWSFAVMQDAAYRLKKDTPAFLGAGCSKEKCAKCVYQYCRHECHANQVFLDPITVEGKWKGLKHFAWINPDDYAGQAYA